MLYKRLITDILDTHAKQLLANLDTSKDYISLFPNQTDLHTLLHLAGHISTMLVPVKPTVEFRQQLYQDLMAVAHRSLTEPKTTRHKVPTLLSPKISIALTMVITLLVGFFWRRRRQRSAALMPNLPPITDQELLQ